MSTLARVLAFFFTWQFWIFSLTSVVSTGAIAVASGMYRKPSNGWQTGLISGTAFALGVVAAFSIM